VKSSRRAAIRSPRFLLLIAVSVAAACLSSHEGLTQDKIGTAQVSILSVATWDAYMNGLQPEFQLTADQALAKVLPSMTRSDDRILDALQAALKASAPVKPAEDNREKSGEGSPAGTGSAAGAGVIESRVRGGKPEGERAVDPVLQYQAAAALFQEVQLLNRYVRDAAQRRDSTPYVVRLQVSVSPWKREQGYDAFTNVSFFPGRDPIKGILDQYTKGGGRTAPSGVIPGSPTEYASYAAPRGVNVVPLLVTGDLESAKRASNEAKLRQYGVALDVVMNGLGGGEVDMKALNEKLRLASGQDADSLTSVGKVTENTFCIRSSAVQTGAADRESGAIGYSMLAQTHNFTVLILVPNTPERPIDAVHLVARTTFREPGTGREAPVEDREEWNEALLAIRSTIPWTDEFRLEDFQRLQMWVWNSLYPPFVQDLDAIVRVRLRDRLSDSQEAAATWQRIRNDQDSLWVEIASLLSRSRYTLSDVDLPRIVAPIVAAEQAALIVDDGVSASTVTISGGGGLVRSNLSGFLTLPASDANAPAASIGATRIEVRDDGHTLVLTFPSLQASGLVKAPPPAAGAAAKEGGSATFLQNASVRVDAIDAGSWTSASTSKTIFVSKGVVWARPGESNVAAPAAPAAPAGASGAIPPGAAAAEGPKPFFDVAIGARVIVADENGHGQIRVAWQLTKPGTNETPPGKVVFRVEGADLESVAGDPIDAISSIAGRWLVSQNASAILTLGNLARNTPVKVISADEKGAASTTTELSVQTVPPKSSSKSD
jgi:hypothetical protein